MILKQIIYRLVNNPVKSLLTIISIALGVMIVTLVINMNLKLSRLMEDSQSKTITNIINGKKITEWDHDYGETILGTKQIIDDLKTTTQGIKNITPYKPWVENVFYYNQDKYAVQMAYATGPSYISMFNLDIIEGAVFKQGDEVMEVMISNSVSEVLFGQESAIGKVIQFIKEWTDDNEEFHSIVKDFTIVGVYKEPIPILKEKDGIPDMIYSISGYSEKYGTGRQLIVEFEKAYAENSKVKLTQAINKITGEELELIVWHGRPNSTQEQLWYESIITLVNISFVIFAIIALMVSSFGVFSMTTVSILEKNKEIGLKRALGGTRFDIIKQFLMEAVFTILIGSVIGILLAVIFSPLFISNVLPCITGGEIDLSVGMNMRLNPIAGLFAVLVTVISGGLFGLFPSLTAAKSQPIEAIREN